MIPAGSFGVRGACGEGGSELRLVWLFLSCVSVFAVCLNGGRKGQTKPGLNPEKLVQLHWRCLLSFHCPCSAAELLSECHKF